MTSSDGKRGDGKRRGRSAFFWFPVTLLVVAALLVAGWYVAAHLARLRGRTIIAQLEAAGKSVDCRDAAITGFPISFGIGCKAISYRDEIEGFSLTSAAANALMPLYDPFRMNVSLDGPASIEAPQTAPLSLDWRKLDARLSLGLSEVTGIIVDGEAIDVKDASNRTDQPEILSLGAARVAIEPNGGDLDIAVSLSDTAFGAALPDLQGLPAISGTASVRVFNGASLLQTGLDSLRNRQFLINTLTLDPGSDSSAAIAGNISFDRNGLADGNLRVRLHNLKALSAILVRAFPQEARKISPAFAMLGALGNDQTVPVELRKGRITLGFFKIGRLPPVD